MRSFLLLLLLKSKGFQLLFVVLIDLSLTLLVQPLSQWSRVLYKFLEFNPSDVDIVLYLQLRHDLEALQYFISYA